MMEKEDMIIILKAIGPIIGLVLISLIIPWGAYSIYGEFTYDIIGTSERYETKKDQEEYQRVAEYCDFYINKDKWGYYNCDRPCVRHSLDDKDCVSKGCVDSGPFGLGMQCDWYVCEGYGDIRSQCLSTWHGSKEDYCKEHSDDMFYCM